MYVKQYFYLNKNYYDDFIFRNSKIYSMLNTIDSGAKEL